MNLNTIPPANEVGRLVIHLPDDATFYGERFYLPVALDLVEGSETPHPSLLRAEQQGIRYMAQCEVFSALCGDRAQRTVDQTLLVGGDPVTPERYLGMWQAAIASSVSPETAAKEHGIRPVAVLWGPLAAMSGAKSSWTHGQAGRLQRAPRGEASTASLSRSKAATTSSARP